MHGCTTKCTFKGVRFFNGVWVFIFENKIRRAGTIKVSCYQSNSKRVFFFVTEHFSAPTANEPKVNEQESSLSRKIFLSFSIDGCSLIKLFCYECVISICWEGLPLTKLVTDSFGLLCRRSPKQLHACTRCTMKTTSKTKAFYSAE